MKLRLLYIVHEKLYQTFIKYFQPNFLQNVRLTLTVIHKADYFTSITFCNLREPSIYITATCHCVCVYIHLHLIEYLPTPTSQINSFVLWKLNHKIICIKALFKWNTSQHQSIIIKEKVFPHAFPYIVNIITSHCKSYITLKESHEEICTTICFLNSHHKASAWYAYFSKSAGWVGILLGWYIAIYCSL